jgi:hypothetical protein
MVSLKEIRERNSNKSTHEFSLKEVADLIESVQHVDSYNPIPSWYLAYQSKAKQFVNLTLLEKKILRSNEEIRGQTDVQNLSYYFCSLPINKIPPSIFEIGTATRPSPIRDLMENILARGYNSNRPIILKASSRGLYCYDGNHRLLALRLLIKLHRLKSTITMPVVLMYAKYLKAT